MKLNELKEKIKSDIYQSTPDVYSKIDLNMINIEHGKKTIVRKRSIKPTFKFAFSSMMTLILVFILIVLIVKPGENGGINVFNYSPLETNEEVYAVSSVVASNLYFSTFSNKETLSLSDNNLLIEDEYENLNNVLNSIESLISNNRKETVVQLKSDDNNYALLLEINSIDWMMFESTYYLYYNVIEQLDLEPIKANDKDKGNGKGKSDQDKDYLNEKSDILEDIQDLDESLDGKIKTRIEGKIKFKNNLEFSYNVNGQIIENKGMTKVVFDIFSSGEPNNYIRVIQSQHKNKQIFIFKQYENNVLKFKNYLVLKTDKKGAYSAELIVDESNLNKLSKYEISKDIEDKQIEIEYLVIFDDQMEKGEILITIIESENAYQYSYETKSDKGNGTHKGKRFGFSNQGPLSNYMLGVCVI